MHRIAASLALVLMLCLVWSLTHRYKGLAGDAELYAVQAVARIHPQLAGDLFLQNVSQDRYTIFSPLYAWCIDLVGIQSAGLALTVFFKIWFLGASWLAVRGIYDGRAAFLATASLIVTVGAYGAFSVFHYAEDWVTARSFAEALVVTALACFFWNQRLVALFVALGALFVHPLMAIPGVLLIIFMWLPFRISLAAAVLGTLTAAAIAYSAVKVPAVADIFTIIDSDWLEIVRERSQFLFLQLWTPSDWKLTAWPFLSLAVSACALRDTRVRRFCAVAALIGVAGLIFALIGSLIGPVAIFLQGQPWRWVWITKFASVVLLAPTAITIWSNDRCGPLCALLLLCGSTVTTVDSVSCILAALGLWAVRDLVTARGARFLRWAAVSVGAILFIWTVGNVWTLIHTLPSESGREPASVTVFRNIFGLEGVAALLVWAFVYWVRSARSSLILSGVSMAMVIALTVVLPGTFNDMGRSGKTAGVAEFADWRGAIPSGNTVFVVPSPASAAFAWLTLERPSYLSIDQSSGVVFSRETAMEIRRRSEVVAALWDTNWRLLSRTKKRVSAGAGLDAPNRPLTRETLGHVCRDPLVNFVVAKEDVGFEPLHHTQVGNWKDWNLYDCLRVNVQANTK